ncbi:hypothetical protein [Geoalkalibacter sp.]|jgi:hypothetical protein|uniref:hypothetical protein n=1 Tax=Geoalkalibacter sp. TaxID=3041440 RepID=UPI00272EAB21|nr:hypothetical protein [Geoalkalibacter sp.]
MKGSFNRLILLFLILFLGAPVFSPTLATADAERSSPPGAQALREIYDQSRARLEDTSFGLPLFLDSDAQGSLVQVDVHGILDYPFAALADALQEPGNWCEIVFLHPNVKACTFTETPQDWRLAFYLGRKYYQAPHEANQVIYEYRILARDSAYLDLLLLAEIGPFGTRNHRIRVEALPLGPERSFMRVGYSYENSLRLRLAERAYFSTLGAGKIGFTVIGEDAHGNPVRIGGARGAVERNAVRYYFAIHSFMHALAAPAQERVTLRLRHWYDLTDRFREQLFELEREEYLEIKEREHENQRRLQREARVPFL